MCDDQWWEDDQRINVSETGQGSVEREGGALKADSESLSWMDISLARAFKRAGWKVIGVEEEG